MSIYDVINKWNLNKEKLNFNRYTRRAISAIANDVQACYQGNLPPLTGRFHQSLTTATEIVENRKPIEELAWPLLYSKQLILPDPLYSVLSPKANSTWSRLPESGCQGFSDTPCIYSQWKTYWSTPFNGSIEYLNGTVPSLVAQLMKLKPLVEAGFILLQPWELAVDPEIASIKEAVRDLRKQTNIINEVTQRFKQSEYNLGVRLGAISITAKENCPATGLKKGDALWVGDKTEILVMGLVHSLLASQYHSNFVETLPGDRVVFDFVRTGGVLRPAMQNLSGVVKIPNLANALWPDIVAIKKDSELLNKLQERISDLACCDNDDQLEVVRDRLAELQSQLTNDAAFTKSRKLPISELIVSSAVGAASNMITGAELITAALASTLTAGTMFTHKLISEYFDKENHSARKRRDLIVRINSRIQ